MERLYPPRAPATREQLAALDKVARLAVRKIKWDKDKGACTKIPLDSIEVSGSNEQVDVQFGYGYIFVNYSKSKEDSLHVMITSDDPTTAGSAQIGVGEYEHKEMHVLGNDNAVSSVAAELLIEKVAQASHLYPRTDYSTLS